jgi:hypothetical protein
VENNMEKEPKNELTNKLNEKRLQEFIKQREIRNEDLRLIVIERLASFPKKSSYYGAS